MLTDPTFDPPGRRYNFGWGRSSRKLAGPAIAAADLGPIDAVLLTHDHHGDNLDDAGRALLPSAGAVVTTRRRRGAARRYARGLAPWETTTLEAPGRPTIEVTATPCRHGPPASPSDRRRRHRLRAAVGGQQHGVLWISGDTVLYDGVREVADRLDVGRRAPAPRRRALRRHRTAALHDDRARRGRALRARCGRASSIPVHYEGWSHFRQGRAEIERAFAGVAARRPLAAAGRAGDALSRAAR